MPGTRTVESSNPSRLLQFTEDDHKYIAKTRQNEVIKELISVTTLIGKYFPEFNADIMAPRVAAKRGVSVEEIKAEWKKAGDDASRYGTRVHEYMEDLINGNKPRNTPENEKEKLVFLYGSKFIGKIKARFDKFCPEKMVCDIPLGIAGTIDLLCRDPHDDSLVMLDWKTNKQIRTEDQYGKYGFPPISHISDCEFGHYSLQLNMYEFILKHAGYIKDTEKVTKYLVHLHPDLGAVPIKVPNMKREILLIVDDFTKKSK